MRKTITNCEHKFLCLIIFILMLGSVLNSSAEEIQPITQLKEFPRIPKLPNVEPIRIPELIKPFASPSVGIDGSKLLSLPPPNFDKSQLLGDWKAKQPFLAKYIGGATTIEGILFTVLPESSMAKEWTSEGVMYESTTKEGARRFASSFNYKVLKNIVLLMITFSANEIENGIIIPFEVLGIFNASDKTRILKLKNDGNTIELIDDNKQKFYK